MPLGGRATSFRGAEEEEEEESDLTALVNSSDTPKNPRHDDTTTIDKPRTRLYRCTLCSRMPHFSSLSSLCCCFISFNSLYAERSFVYVRRGFLFDLCGQQHHHPPQPSQRGWKRKEERGSGWVQRSPRGHYFSLPPPPPPPSLPFSREKDGFLKGGGGDSVEMVSSLSLSLSMREIT